MFQMTPSTIYAELLMKLPLLLLVSFLMMWLMNSENSEGRNRKPRIEEKRECEWNI